MSKLLVRLCVVVLAASFALALTPAASHASALAPRPVGPPVHASWLDAFQASVAALFPTLPSVAPRSLAPPAKRTRTRTPGWLHPTCGVIIDPWGTCG